MDPAATISGNEKSGLLNINLNADDGKYGVTLEAKTVDRFGRCRVQSSRLKTPQHVSFRKHLRDLGSDGSWTTVVLPYRACYFASGRFFFGHSKLAAFAGGKIRIKGTDYRHLDSIAYILLSQTSIRHGRHKSISCSTRRAILSCRYATTSTVSAGQLGSQEQSGRT